MFTAAVNVAATISDRSNVTTASSSAKVKPCASTTLNSNSVTGRPVTHWAY